MFAELNQIQIAMSTTVMMDRFSRAWQITLIADRIYIFFFSGYVVQSQHLKLHSEFVQ